MNGKILFKTWEDLAEFLKAFTGSTATFEAEERGAVIVLEFKGGF